MSASVYDEMVGKNMAHLGTALADWTAVPVIGFARCTDGARSANAAILAIPPGYSHAPTLYSPAGNEACCELCSHPVKFLYGIQCDSKRWYMLVGSECVTRFGEGVSGEELVRRHRLDRARAIRARMQDLARLARFASSLSLQVLQPPRVARDFRAAACVLQRQRGRTADEASEKWLLGWLSRNESKGCAAVKTAEDLLKAHARAVAEAAKRVSGGLLASAAMTPNAWDKVRLEDESSRILSLAAKVEEVARE